ncbi:NAD-dependent epimerase/dehydratase family protein [Microbispora sp. NBRC 16548]|uniref:NAD-dependent epimerase/dehydratase family protein n=1 Tax=Microbispora sp. NBRC 16548 TaxID=3030994 RepID=UPI0024A16C81|nr:NAD-dependent epimerase/dehydratase family protein [Microbispora sp. NBRC 16548]GLX09394.1 UDP-glucose 4-epimerase [Microbispora sp. NBRC 16548]
MPRVRTIDPRPSSRSSTRKEGLSYAGTRALVTGAAGFIGARLVKRLVSLGAEVHAVSRKPPTVTHVGEVWHRADLRVAAATGELLGAVRPDVVFHLAGEVNGGRDTGLVLPTLENNLLGTVNLLTAAVGRTGTRVVLCGSCEEPRPANDHAPPPSPYAMAKWAATGYAQLFQRLWDLPATVLRPTMVYGPGQRDLTKLVPYVALSLLRGEEPSLTSGAKMADWVYVDDVAEAFVAAGRSDRAAGHVMDIGTGVLTSVRDTVELLYRVMGSPLRPRFGEVADRPLDNAQTVDIGLAAEVLGWRPAVGLEEGLRRTLAWYREHR